MMAARNLAAIPFLGSGLGLRNEIEPQILADLEEIDFLEIAADKVIYSRERLASLAQLREQIAMVPHGVGLSVGSVAPADEDYLGAIKSLSAVTRSPYYSEHLALTRTPDVDLGHLSPLWFTETSLDTVIRNVHRVQDHLGKPLVLENISYLFAIPEAHMSEAQFFTRLVTATGCGVLLDVTNLHINSVNHGFDAVEYLQQMPLDHVVQAHIAGGKWSGGVLLDTHSEPVEEGSWRLLETLCSMTDVKGVILEHDDNFPQIELLLQQLQRAREILGVRNVRPVRAPDPPSHPAQDMVARADAGRPVCVLADNTAVMAAREKVETRADGAVLVSRTTGLEFGLDAVGARVWDLLQQPRTFAELRDAILAEYEVEPARCERDLCALIERLDRLGFVRAG